MSERFNRSSGASRRRPRRNSGQALVEFAVVVPILILLILGLVDFARAWNTYQVITDAAREGARTAVIDNPTVTEADVLVTMSSAMARAGLNTTDATITITGFRSGRGNPTTVQIDYEYELGWVGLLLALASGDEFLTLSTQFVMRNE